MTEAPNLTVTEVAARWRCSDEHVRQMITRGELRAFRIGRMFRIPKDAVTEIEECATSPEQ